MKKEVETDVRVAGTDIIIETGDTVVFVAAEEDNEQVQQEIGQDAIRVELEKDMVVDNLYIPKGDVLYIIKQDVNYESKRLKRTNNTERKEFTAIKNFTISENRLNKMSATEIREVLDKYQNSMSTDQFLELIEVLERLDNFEDKLRSEQAIQAIHESILKGYNEDYVPVGYTRRGFDKRNLLN